MHLPNTKPNLTDPSYDSHIHSYLFRGSPLRIPSCMSCLSTSYILTLRPSSSDTDAKHTAAHAPSSPPNSLSLRRAFGNYNCRSSSRSTPQSQSRRLQLPSKSVYSNAKLESPIQCFTHILTRRFSHMRLKIYRERYVGLVKWVLSVAT